MPSLLSSAVWGGGWGMKADATEGSPQFWMRNLLPSQPLQHRRLRRSRCPRAPRCLLDLLDLANVCERSRGGRFGDDRGQRHSEVSPTQGGRKRRQSGNPTAEWSDHLRRVPGATQSTAPQGRPAMEQVQNQLSLTSRLALHAAQRVRMFGRLPSHSSSVPSAGRVHRGGHQSGSVMGSSGQSP